jgi:K+-transporting ATPase KdpF subunit
VGLEYLTALVVSAGVLGYLILAMLKPEKF